MDSSHWSIVSATISNSFVPNRQQVAGITNSNPGIVTTTQANGYLPGLFVRFYFPINFGMMQVNGNVYQITPLTPTTFSINVDTTNFDVFAITSTVQFPEVIPVGETADTLVNRVINNRNIIPET